MTCGIWRSSISAWFAATGDDPAMAGFFDNLRSCVNDAAERMPRLCLAAEGRQRQRHQYSAGSAIPSMAVNSICVWESVEALEKFSLADRPSNDLCRASRVLRDARRTRCGGRTVPGVEGRDRNAARRSSDYLATAPANYAFGLEPSACCDASGKQKGAPDADTQAHRRRQGNRGGRQPSRCCRPASRRARRFRASAITSACRSPAIAACAWWNGWARPSRRPPARCRCKDIFPNKDGTPAKINTNSPYAPQGARRA